MQKGKRNQEENICQPGEEVEEPLKEPADDIVDLEVVEQVETRTKKEEEHISPDKEPQIQTLQH